MHNGEHDQHHTQKDMLNYLAQRIVAANPGAHLDALRIFRAFGVTYHGLQYEITTSLEALQNVPTTGLKAGVTLPVTRAKMFDFSEEANRGTGIH